VQEEKSGLLTENDSEALATAVERILDDPDLAQTLREGALERAKAYEIHHTTARLIEVYREAIADHRRGFHLQPDKRKPIFQVAWERLVERTA
jgi:D-inositol-3-phosphate glycosyltransferase